MARQTEPIYKQTKSNRRQGQTDKGKQNTRIKSKDKHNTRINRQRQTKTRKMQIRNK